MATNKELEKEIAEIKERLMEATNEGRGSLAIFGKFEILFAAINKLIEEVEVLKSRIPTNVEDNKQDEV